MSQVKKIVKGFVKAVGTVGKTVAEIGGDTIGTISENINKDESEKTKYSAKGKEIGSNIKAELDQFSEVAGDNIEKGVEVGVEKGKEVIDEIANSIKEAKDKYNKKNK